ncbi:MAG: ComF family protein [Lachnospiraceae bacterium]|nr:ComF family protein [Lachnospiraceae bacterium]
MRIRDVRALTLDLLYPRRCPVCGEAAPWGLDICPECTEKLPYVREPVCRKCGKPVDDMQVYCRDCMNVRHRYVRGRGVFVYDDVMRRMLTDFKYRGRREYGHTIGRLMAQYAVSFMEEWQPDIIVPVPVHASRKRSRGYNQAEILSGEIASYFDMTHAADTLVREGNTAAMKTLSSSERTANIRSAVRCEKPSEDGGSVLIVDDIYTTGATVDACAEVLIEAGYGEIFFLTAAIGAGSLDDM